ncbi:S-layer homology domain-containing protein [Paenibacillus planticolens]|uniref:SLH domain-containing protein n=1 Tax=Paenibacillus planticolens TaxID=2654976 RepID=A0ABX1ZK77_9BACL|nr:S-layer homology domain-containing protein [Paenibacillus planticolens]NOV00490.1 hypothetical protein [Paenibacillus planticolens]
MSESSSNIARSKLKNKTQDIQGGEKKVMKKSLKVIASATLAFSLFASVAMAAETTTPSTDTTTTTTAPAAVKTSKDFKDLEGLDATVLAKIDAMLAKKYFEGTADDSFGIKENMTRAQFAKVLVLVAGVKVDDSVKVSSFEDVKADDSANGWAIPFIEAAKKAGLVDGKTDKTFDPGANVTLGEFATALVKGLGIKPDTSGTPWYADAVKQAVDKKILPEGTDGSKLATRADLVVGAFQADAAIANVGKVSVTEAKASGVYKVEVTFSKAVDTDKAKLALTKGTLAVGTSTTAPKWSDDKKSVTLTTDTRISDGDYTVTLSGLDADAVEKTTATFKATDEQVSKIDFVSASDTIAYSKHAIIKLKASNQYGEATSLSASSFTALVSGVAPSSFKKDDDGNLVIDANVKVAGVTQGNGLVPVTVYFNNSNITISKNFKVGTVPILTKIETGATTYSNTTTNKLTAEGDTVSVALKLFDQYGNAIVKSQFTEIDANTNLPEVSISTINPVVTPYEQHLVVVKSSPVVAEDFFDDNDNPRVKLKLDAKVDKTADYTVNVYGGSASATATISVGAANLATKVEFDTSGVVAAAGDDSVFVPIIATDANGNKLSAQDIVDNKARFIFSGGTGAVLQETGSDKGKLKVTLDPAIRPGNSVYVSAQISQSQTNSFVQTSLPIQDARVPEKITVKTVPAAKAIFGADDKVEYQLKDQYGKDVSKVAASIVSANGQTGAFQVKAYITVTGSGVTVAPKFTTVVNDAAGNPIPIPTADADGNYTFNNAQLVYFNKGFDLNTSPNQIGKATVKAVIQKQVNGGAFSDYTSSTSNSIEAIDSNTSLTYSLNTIGTLYSAVDSLSSTVKGNHIGTADITNAPTSKLAKKLSVIAKDSAGNKVKLPVNFVRSISSSNNSIILTGTNLLDPDQTSVTKDANGYVLGNKPGTATVSAIVYTNKGTTVNLTQEVTVKNDAITVDSIKADNDSASFTSLASLNGTKAYTLFNKLHVFDQYGIEYTQPDDLSSDAVATYYDILGVQYTISGIQGTGTATIDPKTGEISNVGTGVTEFLITAFAPNGKSVTFLVSKKQ